MVPCARSAEVFDRVESGSVHAAVIPIENSLAGSVAEHFDLLLTREVFVHREFYLRIRHNLIAMPGVKMNAIRQVFSHPVALDQCRKFFGSHPRIQAVPFYDTAGSVRHIVAEELHDAAAIAPKQAAGQYGGRVLLAGIEDDQQNYTRFLLIGKSQKDRQRRQQDLDWFCPQECAGCTLQGAERLCPARHQSQQDRIAPAAWPSVGIRFLCRHPSRGRRSIAQCVASPGRDRGIVKVLGVYPAANSRAGELVH